MKKILLTGTLFFTLVSIGVGATTTESSSDTLVRSKDPATGSLDSSGFYFSSALGITSFNEDAAFTYDNKVSAPKTYSIKLKSTNSPLVGFGFGYLFDINKLIATIEYSFQLNTLKAKKTNFILPDGGGTSIGTQHKFFKNTSHNFYLTAGYRLLNAYTPYVGVGLVYEELGYYYNNPGIPVNNEFRQFKWGNVFLIGLRTLLTENIQVKIEYQIQNFSKLNTRELSPDTTTSNGNAIIRPRFKTILLGLNYKF